MKTPLLQYIERIGITQREFCRRSGISQPTVNGWCRGGVPSIADAMRLDAITDGGVSVGEWVAYIEATRANDANP